VTVDSLGKDSARRSALAARTGLSANYRAGASRSIAETLMGLDVIRAPGRMALYRSSGAEVDLQPHEGELRKLGWKLLLPRTTSEVEMEYVDFPEDSELRPGRFSIAEPVETEVVPALRLDAIVCPCVALDRQGHRVGFGAGYHDRVFAGLPGAAGIDRPYLIGVVFDVQLFEHIDADPWDVPMDLVITESGMINPTTGP
jgi:5-formyltetrahydrofolate cyclo-ligase